MTSGNQSWEDGCKITSRLGCLEIDESWPGTGDVRVETRQKRRREGQKIGELTLDNGICPRSGCYQGDIECWCGSRLKRAGYTVSGNARHLLGEGYWASEAER